MIYLFTAINLLNYLDRYLVAAVLPLLVHEFTLTHEAAGRLQSAFVIGYVLFSPVFGYLGDRYSRPRLMALGVALWSAATLCTGLSTGFMLFFLARIFVGIGEASFGTAAPGYIKDRFVDPLKVNSALAIFYSAIPIGSALGYVVGGAVSARYDWRMAFYVGGIPGLVLALVLLGYRETTRQQVKKAPPLGEGLRSIARVRTLRYAIAGYTFNAFALNGIATFIVSYGLILGFSQENITHYFGLILVVTGFIGTMGGGRLASRLARGSADPIATMLKMIGILGILGAPVICCAFLVSDQTLFLVLCFIAELLIFAGVAPVNSILVLSCPERCVTLTQGISILCLNLFGAFLAPIMIGFVADHSSLGTALQLTTIGILGSGIVWFAGGMGKQAGARDASSAA